MTILVANRQGVYADERASYDQSLFVDQCKFTMTSNGFYVIGSGSSLLQRGVGSILETIKVEAEIANQLLDINCNVIEGREDRKVLVMHPNLDDVWVCPTIGGIRPTRLYCTSESTDFPLFLDGSGMDTFLRSLADKHDVLSALTSAVTHGAQCGGNIWLYSLSEKRLVKIGADQSTEVLNAPRNSAVSKLVEFRCGALLNKSGENDEA